MSEAFKGARVVFCGVRALLSPAYHGFNGGFVVHRRPKTWNSHCTSNSGTKDQRLPSLPFDVTQHRCNQSNQQKALAVCVCYKVTASLVSHSSAHFTSTSTPPSNASNMANSILLHEERFPSKTDRSVNAFHEEIHTGHLVGSEARLLVSFRARFH